MLAKSGNTSTCIMSVFQTVCVFSVGMDSLTAAAHGWLALTTSWVFLLF